jgi:hypothetical protein
MENKVAIGLVVLSTSVFATVTVQDISTLQGETLRLKAELTRATVQKQLDETGKSEGSSTAPVVKAVVGVGTALIATFVYANGSSVDARVGDALPGGYRVMEITSNRVTLSQAGRRIVVGFSAEVPVATPQPSVNPAFPVPVRSSP